MASFDDRNQVQMQSYPQQVPQQSLYVGQVVIPPQGGYVNHAQPYASAGVPPPQVAYINNAQPYYAPQGQVVYGGGGGAYYVPQQVTDYSSGALAAPRGAVSQRPQNQWKDSICDCFTNVFPSCWCAFCCCHGIYLVGQISQKTGYWTHQKILISYVMSWILGIVLQLVLGSSFIIWIPALATFIIAANVRIHLVNKDNIRNCGNDPCMNNCGECCETCCCLPCSIAQMGRHVYGYSKVMDGDADIDRPDSYGPV